MVDHGRRMPWPTPTPEKKFGGARRQIFLVSDLKAGSRLDSLAGVRVAEDDRLSGGGPDSAASDQCRPAIGGRRRRTPNRFGRPRHSGCGCACGTSTREQFRVGWAGPLAPRSAAPSTSMCRRARAGWWPFPRSGTGATCANSCFRATTRISTDTVYLVPDAEAALERALFRHGRGRG